MLCQKTTAAPLNSTISYKESTEEIVAYVTATRTENTENFNGNTLIFRGEKRHRWMCVDGCTYTHTRTEGKTDCVCERVRERERFFQSDLSNFFQLQCSSPAQPQWSWHEVGRFTDTQDLFLCFSSNDSLVAQS